MFGNLFAPRHNKPSGLRHVEDPVGPHNDEALRAMGKAANRIIAAWGCRGTWHRRADEVVDFLPGAECLGFTASGQPRHPLYVRGGTKPVPWIRL